MNLYFDNAATSHPKPPEVYQSAAHYLRHIAGSPGRASHNNSLAASRLIYTLREKLAHLFNAPDPSRIVFTFNATDALNMAIKGFVKPGDNVIHTAMDHNSVLRPLAGLQQKGIIDVTTVPCSAAGLPNIDFLRDSITCQTKLLIINHASNVCGTILPLKEMTSLAHEKGVAVLVDAAQSAGILPLDVIDSQIDMLAFCGHKGLLGPPGTGGLYVREGIDLEPWREGGTGSFSGQLIQPSLMPDRLEAGTMNSYGLAGLLAAVDFIAKEGIDKIRAHEREIYSYLYQKLASLPAVRLYNMPDSHSVVSVVSLTIEGMDSGEVGFILQDKYQIQCRTGLHCAPLAHKALGTFPDGTIRISPGYFTGKVDLDYLVHALQEITQQL